MTSVTCDLKVFFVYIEGGQRGEMEEVRGKNCRLPCLYLLTKRNKANWTEMCRNLVAHDQMSMLVIWAIKEWHDECFFEVPNKGIDDDFIDEDDDDDFE